MSQEPRNYRIHKIMSRVVVALAILIVIISLLVSYATDEVAQKGNECRVTRRRAENVVSEAEKLFREVEPNPSVAGFQRVGDLIEQSRGLITKSDTVCREYRELKQQRKNQRQS